MLSIRGVYVLSSYTYTLAFASIVLESFRLR